MNSLNELRHSTEKVLYGLTADESLKQRILQKTEKISETGKSRTFNTVPVFCSVIAALIFAVLILNGLQPVNPVTPGEISVFTAGNDKNDGPEDSFLLLKEYETEKGPIQSVEISGIGTITDPQICSRLITVLKDYSVLGENREYGDKEEIRIVFSDGKAIRLDAEEPYIIGTSCWSCPEFFTLFRQSLVQQ